MDVDLIEQLSEVGLVGILLVLLIAMWRTYRADVEFFRATLERLRSEYESEIARLNEVMRNDLREMIAMRRDVSILSDRQGINREVVRNPGAAKET